MDLALSRSLRSPNTMALPPSRLHASTQAGVSPRSTRCTHSVQDSTVPLPRGTSAFWPLTVSWTKERAPYGQAMTQ